MIAATVLTAWIEPGVNAAAASSLEGMVILVHLAPTASKNPCAFNMHNCADAKTGGLLATPYYAYVLLGGAPLEGLSGAKFGIAYDDSAGRGVDVYSWQSCASTGIPSTGWPASRTGVTVVWDRLEGDPLAGCQRDSAVVAGYLYLEALSQDRLEIIDHPEDGKITLADCDGHEATLPPQFYNGCANRGTASFSTFGGPGLNPCGICPVVPTSWGTIKKLYER